MAARTRRLDLRSALTAWALLLAATLFPFHWYTVEHPIPPIRSVIPTDALRIGVDASYPPFAGATADGLFGLEIDLGKVLGERLGIPVHFVNMGYDGLYDSLRADQVDLVISTLLFDPSRMNDVRYTRHYFNAGLVLVSDSEFESMEDLPGHTLAFELGSEAEAEARRWLRRVLPFETAPYELSQYALDAVRLDQADAALTDAVSAHLYLREHPAWNATIAQVTDSGYVIASRNDRVDLWRAVNWGLNTLESDGTLADLISIWL